MPLFAVDIFDRSRSSLNDRAGDVYTDDTLLPFLNNAWEELQTDLQAHGLPATTQTTSVLTIEPGTLKLDGLSTPNLPANMIEPLDVYERTPGATKWSPMEEIPYGLFRGELRSNLGSWRWEEDGLQFIGSYNPVEILIRYTRSFDELSGPNSPITLPGAKLFFIYRTAAEAARDIGQNSSRADKLDFKAEWEKSKYIATRVNGLQGQPVRKRGFASKPRNRTHLPY